MKNSFSSLLVVLAKELRLLVRDRMALFFAFAFPAILALFLGAMYASEGGAIPVVCVVTEPTPVSNSLAARIESSSQLDVSFRAREKDALAQLEKGSVAAVVAIRGSDRIEIVGDPSRKHESSLVFALVSQYSFAEQKIKTNIAISTRQASFRGGLVPSPYAVSFPQGMLWALLGAAATFATNLATERRSGTLARLHMTPVSRGTPFFGTVLACALTACAVQVAIVLSGIAFVQLEVVSPIKLLFVIVFASVAIASIVIGLSSLVGTERSAGSLVWGAGIVMAMLGGGMFPLFLFPSWLDVLSYASPLRWATIALEGALWRDLPWVDMALPLLLLMAGAGFCAAIGIKRTRNA